MMDFSVVANDGEKDGKCSLSGNLGMLFMDFFITSWRKLGHKYTAFHDMLMCLNVLKNC